MSIDYRQFAEYDDHQEVVTLHDLSTGLEGFIAIHRQRGSFPSLGATRLWTYDRPEYALQDALRLSRLMTYKSAAAGLPYGGAKAVIMMPKGGVVDRAALFRSYAEHVNQLQGRFVTGTDVGLQNEDLDVMSRASQYMIGYGVDAGFYTGLGAFYGIQICMQVLTGSESVEGKRFAIQGLGKTGFELLKLLYQHGARDFVVSDIDPQKVSLAYDSIPDVKVVDAADIHRQEVDVFSPCALSYSINPSTVGELNCRAVVGAANNQLESPAMGERLFERGILYVPDYVSNSGGLISVVDQFEHGEHDDHRIREKLARVQGVIQSLVIKSQLEDRPVNVIADEMARVFFDADSFIYRPRPQGALREVGTQELEGEKISVS